MKKIIVLTNIPSPYRVLQFDKLNAINDNVTIVYDNKIEKNRKWTVPKLNHKHDYLTSKKKYLGVIRYLYFEKPDVVIAGGGFDLKVIVAFLYSLIFKKKFIVFTDSWLHSTNQLTFIHKIIRKFIIPKSNAHICVGKKGKVYLQQYGAKENSIFISPLAIDNNLYNNYYKSIEDREYDIIFSGQFIDRKLPFFIIDILSDLNKIKKIKFLIIGSGPLKNQILNKLNENKIDYYYPGFIQQDLLPKYYSNAKILLFPTKDDPWGLVANEACAVGTPVITCDNAGVAEDLVINNFNGFVLPLNKQIWVNNSLKLLNDKLLLKRFSINSRDHVKKYSLAKSAIGINDAIRYTEINH